MYKGFELITSFEFKKTPVTIYKSKQTGLSIVVVGVSGPLVQGYFTIATEAERHDGCPHVLEHMIFLGSEDYPYKGVLDLLANRCFASGTNAWTAVDHTCYTLSTAGHEGFLNILPVYLDHILYPTITDEGFHTEVHHIDGEGEDAGVVYCEMNSKENTPFSKTYHTMMETLFEGSGYAKNTGGRVDDLRKLNVKTVREYHKEFYRPNNMCIIVTGDVKPELVIDALLPFEEKIIKKNYKYSNKKPWNYTLPPLEKSIEKQILFPSNDEKGGAIVYVAWRDETKWDDYLERIAMSILWEYLTESSLSLLQKVFIEGEEPYCGRIHYNVTETVNIAQYVAFTNVPTNKADLIKDKLFEVLREHCKEGIDMKRIQLMIQRRRVKFDLDFEVEPHESFINFIIGDFLYGKSKDSLKEYLNEAPILDELSKKQANYWKDLIENYLLNKPYVLIVSKPSIEFGKQIAKEEQERLEKQKKEYENKLDELARQLEEANAKNEIPPPTELLKKFKIPDVNKIPSIPITTFHTNMKTFSKECKQMVEFMDKDSNKQFPFYLQADCVASEFVEITAYLNTNELSEELKYFIELYLECVFDLPMKLEDGTVIEHEDVVFQLHSDLVDKSNGCGLTGGNFQCGPFAQLMWLRIVAEKSKYEKAIKWMRNLLWFVEFSPDRLKVAANKLIQDVARVKRSASSVARAGLRHLNYDKKSNHIITNMIKQYNFLTNIVKRLETEPEKVQSEMNTFRDIVTKPENLRIHLVCDIYAQQKPKSIWIDHFLPKKYLEKNQTFQVSPIITSSKLLVPQKTTEKRDGIIFGLASTDSGFLFQSCQSISDFSHKHQAAILTAIECFTALEGPFWKGIRGNGLSYHYGMYLNIEEGLLFFILGQSENLSQAYSAAKSIVDSYVKGESTFEEHTIEAAKSSLIFEFYSTERTMEQAARQRFRYLSLEGVSHDFTQRLLDQVSKVTKEDIDFAIKEYLQKLFDVKETNVCVVVNIGFVKDIQEEFKKIERTLNEQNIDEYFK